LTDLALVTGATGFVGSALCRKLLAEGYKVRALHRSRSALQALDGLKVERFEGDILQPDTLVPALQGVRWLFHAAARSDYWRDASGVLQSAVEGTRNVLLAALHAGVERVVLTSSSSAMGIPQGDELLDETSTFNLPPERFPYGYAKRQSELVALELTEQGLAVVIVNPSIVLGAGDINQISGSLVVQSARGHAFLWVDGGTNLIHVDDVACGHLAALRRGRSGERYILGHENLTHRQVFKRLAEITGQRKPWFHLPGALINPAAIGVDLVRKVLPLPLDGNQLRMSANYLWYDTGKATDELGFSARIGYETAARQAYDWYRQQGIL